MIRIAIADDHALFREGLVALLARIGGARVVGEAADGETALALVAAERPDALLLDVEMPGPATSALLPRLRRASPATAVLVVTMHGDRMLAERLREAGAADVVAKSVPTAELVARIRAALARHRAGAGDAPAPPARDPLTAREAEVLHCVALGRTNAEIAAALSLAPGTVKRHLANIGRRLGTANRLEHVRAARALGLLGDAPGEA